MNDHPTEIDKLRKEVERLQQAFSTSLVMLQATHHLAMSAALTHPDRGLVADAFEVISARGNDHLLNSLTTDADLDRVNQLNATILKVLRSPG